MIRWYGSRIHWRYCHWIWLPRPPWNVSISGFCSHRWWSETTTHLTRCTLWLSLLRLLALPPWSDLDVASLEHIFTVGISVLSLYRNSPLRMSLNASDKTKTSHLFEVLGDFYWRRYNELASSTYQEEGNLIQISTVRCSCLGKCQRCLTSSHGDWCLHCCRFTCVKTQCNPVEMSIQNITTFVFSSLHFSWGEFLRVPREKSNNTHQNTREFAMIRFDAGEASASRIFYADLC